MAMTRIWNVTNDPNTDVVPQNLMVLGKLLKPGQSMQVDEDLLKKAHKTKKDIAQKLLAVGKAPPASVAPRKKITLPDTVARAHGEVQVAAIAAAASVKVEEKLVEKSDAKPAESDKSAESDNDSKGWKHRKGR